MFLTIGLIPIFCIACKVGLTYNVTVQSQPRKLSFSWCGVSGIVKVSTGVLQLEKLSAGDASNRKPKYKR